MSNIVQCLNGSHLQSSYFSAVGESLAKAIAADLLAPTAIGCTTPMFFPRLPKMHLPLGKREIEHGQVQHVHKEHVV